MRHRRAGKKLGRDTSHRKAVLRNLVTSLFEHEEISTTHAKAKAIRPITEKMITLAKRGDLHARRQALAYLMDKSVAHKLFEKMKDRFADREGGYVRILRAGNRIGDNAPLAIVQLLLAGEGKVVGKATKKDAKGLKKSTKKVAEEKETSPEEVKVVESKKQAKSIGRKSSSSKTKSTKNSKEKSATSPRNKKKPEHKQVDASKQAKHADG